MSGRLMEGITDGLLGNSLQNLKSLSLSGNQYLSDALLNRFISSAPYLEEFDLSSCSLQFHLGLVKKFYPAGVDINTNASESVLTFYFVMQFLLERAKHIKRLSFSKTLIDGAALKSLSEVKDLMLESLLVHNCDQLTNAGILSLCQHQIYLRKLDIGLCTRVTDQSLVYICDNLINLEHLNIQRCRAVTDLGLAHLQKLHKLKCLNISQCELITKEGIEKGLCSDINYIIEELDINSLNLDHTAVIMVSEKMPNLRSLNISYCFNAVTDTSIQVIFKNQTSLVTLKLSHCDKVSDAGLTGMGKGQDDDDDDDDGPIMSSYNNDNKHPRIHLGSRAEEEIVRDARRKRDVMNMCEKVTTESYNGYSLARIKGLRELDINGCNRITDGCNQLTDKTIEAIRSHCNKLKILDVQGCRNISADVACSIGTPSTLHTVLISKPGPYISDGLKKKTPPPPFLPRLMQKLRLH
ncbi:hypothetical protein EVAR_67733_1 [Eumeta japonica]|uniref:F-box/LRR-repeat protein 15-like leucin rich repeat domain-containing protein n=1 Tax=Eumeta variegata TaxID=151549 RepID=A0A4C1ZAF6_EUMVA|nr:hypothetical protein EVAR_67733_1 [Eumeta japonica]